MGRPRIKRIRGYRRLFATGLALLVSGAGASAPCSADVLAYPKQGALEITLHDAIDSPIYSWPRTLLSYPVDFASCLCRAGQLHLLDKANAEVPFQLSSVVAAQDGRLVSAQLNLFADLTPGATRTFHLVAGEDRAVSAEGQPGITQKRIGDEIEVDAGSVEVRLPASQSVSEAMPMPAPILGLQAGSAGDHGPIGRNTITIEGTGTKGTVRIETRELEAGSLFRTYRVTYRFSDGGVYTATLRIVAGYPFVRFSERMEKIAPERKVALDMDWQGFAPTRRFAANGWMQPRGELGIDEPVATPGIIEEPHWFPADHVEDPSKEMIFHLAAFEGNAPRDAVPAMSFWESGEDARELSVFVPDTATWNDGQYMIWQPSTRLQVSFRYSDGRLVWHWPLISGTRATGIALTPVAVGEDAMRRMRAAYASEGKDYPHAFEGNGAFSPSSLNGRYAEWLRAWYGSLDLDRVKDWVLTYPATARPAPAPLQAEPADPKDLAAQASKFESQVLHSVLMDYPLGSNLGIMNISHRVVRPIVEDYLRVHTGLTVTQKARVDALLLLSSYINAGEDLAPVRTALSGTPNMSADGFSVPAEIGILFPDHPMAPRWREQFAKTVQLQSTFYTRPDVPAYDARGGRWAESLATYNWADFVPLLTAQVALTHTDGVNRIANPAMAQRARWMVDELSAPVYNPDPYWRQEGAAPPAPSPWKPGLPLTPANSFERQYPAHGAHGSGTGIVVPYDVPVLAKYLRDYDPIAAEHLLWAYAQRTSKAQSEGTEMYWRRGVLDEMKGNTGTNPHLRSSKYTGHGLILRNGVDTPGEVSVHLDQVDQGPNYRWGDNGEGASGVLYFFANGQPWAGHERENTGDHSNDDATGITTFAVLHDHAWRSIGENVLDRPLYDLGDIQYGEIAARTDHDPYSWPAYRSRSVMLVGTDYAILGDDAEGETRFSWFTMRDLPYPKIVFLEPATARADHWTEVSTQTSKGVIRDAIGGSIVLFTHKKDEVEMEHMTATKIPALHDADIRQYQWKANAAPSAKGVFFVKTAASRDRVFRAFDTLHYAANGEAFDGRTGVIRSRTDGTTELALVQGTAIEGGGIRLEWPDAASTDTAIRATVALDGELSGDYCHFGTSPAPLTLRSPLAAGARFYLDGKAMSLQRDGAGRLVELVPGCHAWQFSLHLPVPLAPSVERTVNGSGGARVYFAKVDGAERYRLEASMDGGAQWKRVAEGRSSPLTVKGIPDGTKIHVRIVAMNRERESAPGNEYPVYISARAPEPPDGLDLRLGTDSVEIHWGQVLGVGGYRLYRRRVGQSAWTLLYGGQDTTYVDKTATGVRPPDAFPGEAANPASSGGGPLYAYAVAGFNDNGEGAKSPSVDTDPDSWHTWWPAGQGRSFKRQTAFWLPPYVPPAMVPDATYPAE